MNSTAVRFIANGFAMIVFGGLWLLCLPGRPLALLFYMLYRKATGRDFGPSNEGGLMLYEIISFICALPVYALLVWVICSHYTIVHR